MAFSERLLEEVQSKSDIVEIIGGYIPLKRAGRNFRANCPFHKEKTPSFMVSPAKQIFHCFGCGAGGNVFGFVMKFEGVEFPEAVRMLAEKAKVELPRFTRGDFEKSDYASQIYRINGFAASYYHSMLLKTEAGKRALEYLKKRGIEDRVTEQAKLGFAGEKRDGLVGFAESKGLKPALLERAGLALAREDGGYYDRFRNKVMFPIFDVKNRVIAFGARVLDNSHPKYINSPETEVYVKSRHLYGLNFSLSAVKEADMCVVVEGYLDFLVPYQYGTKCIAASLGTSLTEPQARLIKRYTKNVVMLYDGDAAGEAASLRGLDIFVQEGVNVRVATLPKGYDPDSFVRERGAGEFNSIIAAAADLFDYKLEILTSKYGTGEARAKAVVCAEMLPTIAKVSDAVLKFEYLKKLAERLNVGEEALLAELKKVRPDYSYEPSQAIEEKAHRAETAEKILLGLMLESPDFILEVRKDLKIEDFTDEDIKRIAAEIFKLCDEHKAFTVAGLTIKLNEPRLSAVVSEAVGLAERIENSGDKHKNLRDCVRWIKNRDAKNKLSELQNLIKVAQALGDEQKAYQLLLEYNKLLNAGRKELARR